LISLLKMRFVKQHKTIEIKNFDDISKIPRKKKHGALLPNSIRALIVGPSNCGKTNLMISLLESKNGLKFANVYLYSKSLFQAKYQYLQKLLSSIKEIGFFAFNENSDVISPDEAKTNSVFIFDDVACEKQNNIRSYFCMGRHKNIDSFYLCQTYTRIPKHLIRDNANFIIMFKQDQMNIKHVFSDHVAADMSLEKFFELCAECWKDKYGFIVISKDDSMENGRYRKGFDTFIQQL